VPDGRRAFSKASGSTSVRSQRELLDYQIAFGDVAGIPGRGDVLERSASIEVHSRQTAFVDAVFADPNIQPPHL
jgi:hypothetical protein